MHEKTKGFYFGSNIKIVDPWTKKKRDVSMKPFMVDNSVRIFERGKIMLTDKDKVLTRQLTSYRIKSFGMNGKPIFIDEDEHSVDTLNLALLTFSQEYTDMFKAMFDTGIKKVNLNLNAKSDWSDRVNKLLEFNDKVTVTKWEELDSNTLFYSESNNRNRNNNRLKSNGFYERRKIR